MIGYLRKRRAGKNARQILRHARHLRNMREDVMTGDQLQALENSEKALRESLDRKDYAAVDGAGDALIQTVGRLTPKRSFGSLRENVEVIAVAIAVAMAFRAYFVQPFKIPTGSMQPTLFGITASDRRTPGWTDRIPVRYLKWFITGELYRDVKVKRGGTLAIVADATGRPYVSPNFPGDIYYLVSGTKYRIPKGAEVNFSPGEYVPDGSILWSGSRTAGDHIFVDKVSWNFRRPRRGEIMVFNTTGITELESGLAKDAKGKPISTHYVKRMAGLPGEIISIEPPELLVNGTPSRDHAGIRRIADREPGYAGYTVARHNTGHIRATGESFKLDDRSYFALGDNTRNSRDSRYWGAVPRSNLVGPAWLIYWPFISDRSIAPKGRNGWQFGLAR